MDSHVPLDGLLTPASTKGSAHVVAVGLDRGTTICSGVEAGSNGDLPGPRAVEGDDPCVETHTAEYSAIPLWPERLCPISAIRPSPFDTPWLPRRR